MAVKAGWRGRFFEDFEVGDIYEHPLGQTVTTTDNAWFTLLIQNTAAVHFTKRECRVPRKLTLRASLRDDGNRIGLVVTEPLEGRE